MRVQGACGIYARALRPVKISKRVDGRDTKPGAGAGKGAHDIRPRGRRRGPHGSTPKRTRRAGAGHVNPSRPAIGECGARRGRGRGPLLAPAAIPGCTPGGASGAAGAPGPLALPRAPPPAFRLPSVAAVPGPRTVRAPAFAPSLAVLGGRGATVAHAVTARGELSTGESRSSNMYN